MHFLAIKPIHKLKKFLLLICISVLTFSAWYVESKPRITNTFGYSLTGFARIKIKNETPKNLACWVAIDGFKKKFRLPANTTSQWITTNDKRFNYANFRTWCDYIELHPEYLAYNRG